MIHRPAGIRQPHAQGNIALRGELERVGEQVLQNLLEPLRVRDQCARHVRIEFHLEGKVLGIGHMAEVALDGIPQ